MLTCSQFFFGGWQHDVFDDLGNIEIDDLLNYGHKLHRELQKTNYASYTQQWPHGRSPPTATFLVERRFQIQGTPSE